MRRARGSLVALVVLGVLAVLASRQVQALKPGRPIKKAAGETPTRKANETSTPEPTATVQLTPTPTTQQCTANTYNYYGQPADERELAIAKINAFCTAGLLVFAALQMVYVRRSTKAAEDSASAADFSAKAAADNAKAAADGVKHAEIQAGLAKTAMEISNQQFRQEQRPWLAVNGEVILDPEKHGIKVNERLPIRFDLVNLGKTPATDIEVIFCWRPIAGPGDALKPESGYPESKVEKIGLIAPGATRAVYGDLSPMVDGATMESLNARLMGGIVPKNFANLFLDGMNTMAVYGRVRYFGPFDGYGCVTEFFLIRLAPDRWVAAGPHNSCT